MGAGPMTGRGLGYCNPTFNAYGPAYAYGPQFARGYGYGQWLGFRAGFGPGYARGRGWGLGRGVRGGFGPGMGRGRGYGWRAFYPGWGGGYPPAYAPPYPMAPSEEIEMLKAEAASMKSALDEINKRIEELEKESSGS